MRKPIVSACENPQDRTWKRRTKTKRYISLNGEIVGLGGTVIAVFAFFSLIVPNFLSWATLGSISVQLPELGLLTLAMLLPILTGGLNLSITFSANICGLTLAWILHSHSGGGVEFVAGLILALCVGAIGGAVIGSIVAFTSVHPLLVSLAMMIFLRGVGEFFTRGGDISVTSDYLQFLGYGHVLGLPMPLLIFLIATLSWHFLLSRTRLGFSIYMVGSNSEATRYAGINTKRVFILVYVLSGVMCAIAGIVMLARFSSVRVGHGESYLLITVLACFLGGVNPLGGFGRVISVFLALILLQMLSSGLNLMSVSQHLTTALWGGMIIAVFGLRRLKLLVQDALFFFAKDDAETKKEEDRA